MPRLIKYLSATLAMVLIITLILPIPIMAATAGIPTPASGTVGTNVTISGGGTDGDVISIRFPSSAPEDEVGTHTVASSMWSSSFDIPEAPAGNHTIYIYVNDSPGLNKTFKIIPSIATNKISAVAGTPITISGQGFQANDENISVSFDGSNVLTGISSNAKGSFPATSFTVPVDARGANIVTVSDTASNKATGYLNVYILSPDEWTDGSDCFPVVMGTDTNVFTIAGDGTTMFMWTKTSTAVAKDMQIGDNTIFVASTEGFPATGTITISSGKSPSGTDTVTYTGKTTNSFTGISTLVYNHIIEPLAILPDIPTAIFPTVTPAGETVAAALYKSIDAGITWSTENLSAPATTLGMPITMLKVCKTGTNQLIVIASDRANLYRSVNGGIDWSTVTLATMDSAASSINAIDISECNDGVAIVIGTDVGISFFNPALEVWQNTSTDTLGTLASWKLASATTAAKAVAFSPDFINDNQILAVACDGSNTALVNLIVGNGDWNSTVGKGVLLGSGSAAITGVNSACLAFPGDYNLETSNQVFVGLSGTTPTAAADVYKVNGGPLASTIIDCGLNPSIGVCSLALSGTKDDSTIIASQTGSRIAVITTADISANRPWTKNTYDYQINPIKNPIGVGYKLELASTGILYAGVSGDNSGFYRATADFKSFNGISRMEVTNIYCIQRRGSGGVIVDAGTTGVNAKAMYFHETPAGNYEMRLAAMGNNDTPPMGNKNPGFSFGPTRVIGSNVLYAVTANSRYNIQKSTDAGLTWSTLSSPGGKFIYALTVVTDDLYYIGYSGGIRSNAIIAPHLPLPTAYGILNPSFIRMVGENGILVGCNNNTPFRVPTIWLFSTNNGTSFEVLGDPTQFATAKLYNYAETSKKIYILNSDYKIYSWDLENPNGWGQGYLLGGIPNDDLTAISGMDVITVNTGEAEQKDIIFVAISQSGVDQLYRSLPPVDGTFDFRAYEGTESDALGGQINRIDVYNDDNGSFNLRASLKILNQPYPSFGSVDVLKYYTADYYGSLVLISPINGAELSSQIDLTWDASKSSKPVDYQYEISNDPDFQSLVTFGYTSADTEVNLSTNFNSIAANQFSTNGRLNTFNNNALENGETYYWRVRVNDQPKEKLNSLWSETHSFSLVNSVADGNVSIAVTLEPADRPAGSWVVPLTVKFFARGPGDTDSNVLSDTPVYPPQTVNTERDGDTAVIQCSGIADGTYDVTAVSDHTLMNVSRKVTVDSSTTIPMGTLLEGNANNDNKINIFDYGILFYSWDKSEGDSGFNSAADFNNDGSVGDADFALLKANYGKKSPNLVSLEP